jgi:hypothetical protein
MLVWTTALSEKVATLQMTRGEKWMTFHQHLPATKATILLVKVAPMTIKAPVLCLLQ